MGSNPFMAHGAQFERPSRYAPIFTEEFFTGLWTQRNPLRDAATPYLYRRFYSAARYESLYGGANCEISNRLTIIRRPGCSAYNSQTFPPISKFYEFRQFTGNSENISVIADTSSVIYDATGPMNKTAIFTKSAGAGPAYFQSIGNILYFGDGVDQEKYLQSQTGWITQFWGISSNSGSGSYGPTIAGNGANGGGVGSAWTNPNNVTSAVNYATVNTSGPATSGPNAPAVGGSFNISVNPEGGYGPTDLTSSHFGFSIPGGSTIVGIAVSFERKVTSTLLDTFTDHVQMYKAGIAVGTATSPGSTWTTALSPEYYGSSVDLWGTAWTPADINDVGFGFAVAPEANNNSSTTSYNFIGNTYRITVYYTTGSGQLYSQNLLATQFGFAVPATLGATGVGVSFNAATTGTAQLQVQLLVGGNPSGNPKTVSTLGSSPALFSIGGSADLWGISSLNGAAINDPTFGVQFEALNGYGQTEVNDVLITIYSNGAPSVSQNGVGAFSATVGYRYVYCYGNSLTGHLSSATPASVTTGAFVNISYLGIAVIASSDPQVNQIRLFRTTDGGSTFLELAASPYPNTSTTIHDASPDSSLLVLNIAPIDSVNNPPPVGFINPSYHTDRIWGSVGNTVFYSTAPNENLGVGAESFPPNQFFVFPSLVKKLRPIALGLLVYTISDTYIITGSGTSSDPFLSKPYLTGIGLLAYTAEDVNGSTIYILTTDGQQLAFDPNVGIGQIGAPIGNILQNYPVASSYVAWHVSGSQDQALYVADGSTGWYRWTQTTAPETSPCWSPQAQIAGGAGCVQSVEITPGIHRLLIGPASSGPILYRDVNVYADNGTTYTWNAVLGSIILAPPGQLAEVEFLTLDTNATGNILSVGVLLGEISGTFQNVPVTCNDPVDLPAASSIHGNRYYLIQDGIPIVCRHMQIKISGDETQASADELLSYTIYGSVKQEQ